MSLSVQYFFLYSYIIYSINGWCTEASFFDWLWPHNKDDINEIGLSTPLIAIPFESKTDDEKFLEEAIKFTDIIKSSVLDTCQHKVVLKIKTSCSSMTEEELAKMSVNLLNCQSAVDGREIFPCSDSMSLKECTEKMDGTMWNAYHMMNNRARAVCLAARRAQFQALSEMTVNKLMSAAHSQIKKMDSMVESQNRLEKMTLGTINLMEKGNLAILEQQDQLRIGQKGIHNFISHNLDELVKEKALIAAGHKELSKMTQSIKEKIDEASKELHMQSQEREGHHKQLLTDIEAVLKLTKEIFRRIDESTDKLLLQHAEAASKYQEAVKNLATINETVHYLLQLVDATRTEIDEKFIWVQSFLNNTGIQIGKMSAVAYHVAYLMLGMLFASFLNFSTLSRVALILLVPLNLFVSYTDQTDLALDYMQMTAVLIGTVLVIAACNRLMKPVESQASLEYRTHNTDFTRDGGEHPSSIGSKFRSFRRFFRKLVSLLGNYMPSSSHWMTGSGHFNRNDSQNESYPHGSVAGEIRDDVFGYLHSEDRRSEVSSNSLVREWLRTKVSTPPSASSGSSSQKLCSAICRSSRRRCRNVSSRGSDFCFKHWRGNSELR